MHKKLKSVSIVNILAKLEYTNPTGSGKDRLAKFILDGKPSIEPLEKQKQKD